MAAGLPSPPLPPPAMSTIFPGPAGCGAGGPPLSAGGEPASPAETVSAASTPPASGGDGAPPPPPVLPPTCGGPPPPGLAESWVVFCGDCPLLQPSRPQSARVAAVTISPIHLRVLPGATPGPYHRPRAG